VGRRARSRLRSESAILRGGRGPFRTTVEGAVISTISGRVALHRLLIGGGLFVRRRLGHGRR
jgi:hypothetical protein